MAIAISEDIEKLAQDFEKKTPQQVLEWALGKYPDTVALACSFAEDVAVIDMMVKINPKARVFCLDTGRLNQETYNLMDEVKEKYNMNIEVMFPNTQKTEEMVRKHGMNLFYHSIENRKMCCGVRKVEPLNRILNTLDGWITGLRRDQAATRTKMHKIEIDKDHGNILKINPLLDWSYDDVMNYIKKNGVPYNKLHDMGYPSIGCECCTRPVKEGEDPRAGRWWWELDPIQKECGLHSGQKVQ